MDQFKQYPAARFRNCRIKIARGLSEQACVEAAYVCRRFPALWCAGNLPGCHTIIPRSIVISENSTTLATSNRFSCVCYFVLFEISATYLNKKALPRKGEAPGLTCRCRLSCDSVKTDSRCRCGLDDIWCQLENPLESDPLVVLIIDPPPSLSFPEKSLRPAEWTGGRSGLKGNLHRALCQFG